MVQCLYFFNKFLKKKIYFKSKFKIYVVFIENKFYISNYVIQEEFDLFFKERKSLLFDICMEYKKFKEKLQGQILYYGVGIYLYEKEVVIFVLKL